MQYKREKYLKTVWILMAFLFYSPLIAMADICTSYDTKTATLHIPSVEVGGAYLWLDVMLIGTDPILFRLTDYGESKTKVAQAVFSTESLKLNIPCLDLETSLTYWADLILKAEDSNNSIDLALNDIQANTGSLVINEIVAKDASGGNDWIELFVTGQSPLNLSDYSLVDDDMDHEKVTLPSIILNPGEYVVIQATDDAPEDGSAYVPFKLGGDDSVILYQNDSIIDVFDWEDGDAPEGYSYGRFPDGTGTPRLLIPTPNGTNISSTDSSVETESEEITRPDGWEEASHGKSADPNYEMVFSNSEVKRIDITFTPEDWQAMLDDMTELYGEFGTQNSNNSPGNLPPGPMAARPDMNNGRDINFADENPVWKPCTIQFEGKEWTFVGARFKGNSSLRDSWSSGIMKLPFRLEFDKFEDEYPEIDDQRFYGFEKLSLASNYNDESLIREKVVADIFRDAGVPAPKTAFYQVYVDHGYGEIYYGLYTMVEIPSEPMLEAQFSQSGGNLYKPDGTSASFASYDESSFDKETNEEEADFSDINSLYTALHGDRQNASLWRENMEKVFDVYGFLRWLAVNTTIQNWDTYGQMTHNYYLYSDPGDGLIHWIPWDNNVALKSTGLARMSPLSLDLTSQEVNDEWPLIRYLIDDSVYHAKYVELVEDTVETVFYPERMTGIYTEAQELIRPYVVGASGENAGYTFLSSEAAFDTGLDYLIIHVESRFDDAQEFITLNP
ncbi:Putative spore coat assembly protein (modular protein) [Desulfamplus magnetovallimortis]|uniref:Putative spore coat assembly protein (Modular protein) n=1 Tax=Desulfamplus magnetovallimortis TaxID=1246637 RepID=A0A1W1HH35_9BACT|nr:CotH kinase family protein [Desulfamplus magnetovallimortis]SLM31692.1 Putative spore coat assembly protein (modular protein) [Desulfamplus magnetovallimortis]